MNESMHACIDVSMYTMCTKLFDLIHLPDMAVEGYDKVTTRPVQGCNHVTTRSQQCYSNVATTPPQCRNNDVARSHQHYGKVATR